MAQSADEKVNKLVQELGPDGMEALMRRLSQTETYRSRVRDGIMVAPYDTTSDVKANGPSAERQASLYPLHVEMTKAITASEVADHLDVDEEDMLSYSVRTPMNIDGEPMTQKAYVTAVLVDGSKKSAQIDLRKNAPKALSGGRQDRSNRNDDTDDDGHKQPVSSGQTEPQTSATSDSAKAGQTGQHTSEPGKAARQPEPGKK